MTTSTSNSTDDNSRAGVETQPWEDDTLGNTYVEGDDNTAITFKSP